MALWLFRSGRFCEHETKFLNEGRIYLTWGGFKKELGKVKERDDMLDMLKKDFPDNSPAKYSNMLGQFWSFVKRMSIGDWVCMPTKHKTIHIGEIVSDYKYVPGAENDFYHCRDVKWLGTDIPRTHFDQDVLYSLGAILTVCQVKRNNAESRVRAMQKNGWKSAGVIASGDTETELMEEDGEIGVKDLELSSLDQIARLVISKYKGHGLETLVEAILKAQGFTTYHSDKGPDGGVDLLAAPGTLGFGRPRICVQVKSQESPMERPVLNQLIGTMQNVDADQGLMVCWGGFKSTVKNEVSRLFFKVRLWDQSDLIDQFLANYEKLDEDIRAEIPLKRIWTIASGDDEAKE